MNPSLSNTLADIAAVLEVVFVPILAVELVWLWRKGLLRWGRLKEMLASASGIPFVLAGAAISYGAWLAIFDWISGQLPWSIPSTPLTAVVAVLAADFIYYWEHRFEHEHRLPWDLYHSVHHSSPQYDQTTGLRLGFFDGLLTLGFSTPLVLVGFSPLLVLAANAIVVGYQTWIHTERIGRMPRWFEAVFNSPSHHRGHHGSDAHYLDVNYGAILIVWDRLFGTFQEETTRPVYGLTTQIESSNPIDVQLSQIRLLIRDLRSDRTWGQRLRRLWNKPGWQPTSTPTRVPA